MITDTELRLSFWRDGSTQAERLAAAALRLSGYEELDPQSPLGGPDGKKDIVCRKGGLTWVGAVYFPNGPASFASVRKKFVLDLAGMLVDPEGFVFVTNQTLSPTQRATLTKMAADKKKECAILHLQQLQTLLDSPRGYGVRIQYLRIPMSVEEQLSWAVDSDSQTAKALSANTRELLALRASIDRLKVSQSEIIKTLGISVAAAAPDLISESTFTKQDSFSPVSAQIVPELILLFHRLICFDLPSRAVGRFRREDIHLGNIDGRIATHIIPPGAEQVSTLLIELCEEWREKFHRLRGEPLKLHAIAEFHAKFLLIHPFLDGNGRVARALLMQQCLDLFDRADMTLMNKGAEYYSALQKADVGDYLPLAELIGPVVRK